MRAKVVSFERPGLIAKRRGSREFTVAYGEILTAERLKSGRALRLHVRTANPIRIAGGSETRLIEEELRRRGVRIVDCWGAIIAPTMADLEREVMRQPARMRQSSDNA